MEEEPRIWLPTQYEQPEHRPEDFIKALAQRSQEDEPIGAD